MEKETSKRQVGESFSFRFETFNQIESALEEIFSPSAASMILYTAATRCGIHSCRDIMKDAETKEEALDNLSKLKRKEKWGKISFQDVDFKNAAGKVVIVNSFETIFRKASEPSCYFFKGFLTGFLSELFDKDITITETKCSGKGDEHCEFVFW